jgi:hypothetical protein
MTHPNEPKTVDLTLPEDGSLPPFLLRDPVTNESEFTKMNPNLIDRYKAFAAEAPTEAEAPAKPAKPKAKAAAKANGEAKPAKVKAKAPTEKPAKVAAKGAVKAKAKPVKAERQRDPAKLDVWGLRKGSIKSNAAAIYAKGKGATLAEVKEAVGSVQFNVLKELEARGFEVERSEVKGSGPRPATRYKLKVKA